MRGAKAPVAATEPKPPAKKPLPQRNPAKIVYLKDREPTPSSDSKVEEGEIVPKVFPAEAVLSAFEEPKAPEWERVVETKVTVLGKGTSSDPRRTKRQHVLKWKKVVLSEGAQSSPKGEEPEVQSEG
jgi:hypothetical protein